MLKTPVQLDFGLKKDVKTSKFAKSFAENEILPARKLPI
jgi:hypothetical protein